MCGRGQKEEAGTITDTSIRRMATTRLLLYTTTVEAADALVSVELHSLALLCLSVPLPLFSCSQFKTSSSLLPHHTGHDNPLHLYTPCLAHFKHVPRLQMPDWAVHASL